jgi:4-hydroxy-tetrahydrodipicolinate synthase
MKLQGVMPALVTPFTEGGKGNFRALEKLMAKLRLEGVKDWAPCGSAGEYNVMSAQERADVLKFVADFANKDELLIAGTNAASTRQVIEHTQKARKLGYKTVLMSASFYATPRRTNWWRTTTPCSTKRTSRSFCITTRRRSASRSAFTCSTRLRTHRG